MKNAVVYTLCFKVARFLLLLGSSPQSRQRQSLRQSITDPLHTLGIPPGDKQNMDQEQTFTPTKSNQIEHIDPGEQYEKSDGIA